MGELFEKVMEYLIHTEKPLAVIICFFVIGCALGGFLMWLYCKNIRYYQSERKLQEANSELNAVRQERDDFQKKYSELKEFVGAQRDMKLAQLATEEDAVPFPGFIETKEEEEVRQ